MGSKVQGSGVQRFRGSKVQGFKGSWVQRFKGSGFKGWRTMKIERFEDIEA